MNKIKAVLFDLDGTVVDTIDALLHGVNLTMRELGYPENTREDVIAHINFGARQLVKLSLPVEIQSDDAKVDEALALYREKYAEVYMESDTPYDGIPEVFSTLTKRGYRLAIISNKPDPFVPPLAEVLLPKGSCEIARGQRTGAPAKPDPTVPLELASLLGATGAECALVGDSNVDMITAKNAGMLAVGVTWGYRSRDILMEAGADILADHPLDLLKIFP
jgi:phosphoglycolate phosphatase